MDWTKLLYCISMSGLVLQPYILANLQNRIIVSWLPEGRGGGQADARGGGAEQEHQGRWIRAGVRSGIEGCGKKGGLA
jgi:hypothetical protein